LSALWDRSTLGVAAEKHITERASTVLDHKAATSRRTPKARAMMLFWGALTCQRFGIAQPSVLLLKNT
jgi:hypothetical protein